MSHNIGGLTIEMFTSIEDFESSQYRIRAALQRCSSSFNNYKLYPVLDELIELACDLRKLVNNESKLKAAFPEKLIGFDIKNKKSIYKKKDLSSGEVNEVFDFINWYLPEIQEVIEEGMAIYDFIEDNIAIEQIGLLPMYMREGYFIIPAHQENMMKIYGYETSIVLLKEEKYRTLKTRFLCSFLNKQIIEKTPQMIKLELIKKFPELPTPAVYNLVTDIDFPFAESMFPVAKRKLMRTLPA